MATYLHERVASGAETVTDQLAGTAVSRAGPKGIIRAAFVASEGTNTALLKGRESGKEIIPNGSHASVSGAVTALSLTAEDFIYEGLVNPGEPLELTIVADAAGTSIVGIRTE